VGTGNSGKSSIVRALSFMLFGEWDKSWVRYGFDFCRITLVTNSDVEVVREKGEKVNRYIVKDPNQKEQIYENFGKTVPDNVAKLFQMFPVVVGDGEELNLNLSKQLDSLFLLSRPGSFKAKLIGKLSGAHFLDHALREINKDKKNLAFEKRTKEIEELDLQKQLIEYDNLDYQLQKLQSLGIRIEEVVRKMEFLDKLKRLYSKVCIWKSRYTEVIDQEKQFEKVQNNVGDKLTTLSNQFQQMKQLQSKLLKLNEQIIENKNRIVQSDAQKVTLVDSYIQILKDSKICPTCFNSIPLEVVETVRGHL
jgi:DNA repair ATPase RecN